MWYTKHFHSTFCIAVYKLSSLSLVDDLSGIYFQLL